MRDWIVEGFPTKVEIDGVIYPLKTSFRNSYMTIQAFEDGSLKDHEKAEILIRNLYCEPYPKNLKKALELGIKFLNCGVEDCPNNNPDGRLYSMRKDSKYIYSAILNSPNGVDLNKYKDVHWWEFCSRFMEIGESAFSRIVYLRRQFKKGKLTKDEKMECERIGWDVIDLDGLSREEREALDQYVFGD